MANKKDDFYFDHFVECANYSVKCAECLHDILTDFEPDKLADSLKEIHKIENAADRSKHELMEELMRAFITPIERDSIMRLASTLDDVTDSIEDILIEIYMNGLTAIRPDALEIIDLLTRLCGAMKTALAEFRNFKKSKTLKDLLVTINTLEEEGDALYISSMRNLHTTGENAVTILSWRGIYDKLELCCDTCEHVADIIEQVVVENT